MRIFIQDIVHGNRVIEKGTCLEEIAIKYGYDQETIDILEYFTEKVQASSEQLEQAAKQSGTTKPKSKSRKKK